MTNKWRKRVRLIAIVALVVLIAPGTWLRSPPAKIDESQRISMTAVETKGFDLGDVELVGAWHLDSPNSHFGSYSALLATSDCDFLSASDTGKILRSDRKEHRRFRIPLRQWTQRFGCLRPRQPEQCGRTAQTIDRCRSGSPRSNLRRLDSMAAGSRSGWNLPRPTRSVHGSRSLAPRKLDRLRARWCNARNRIIQPL